VAQDTQKRPNTLEMRATDLTDDGMWDRGRLEALIKNVPGAIYRCSPESDWAMQFLSDEIESISGYPAADFIGSAVRTFASVIHPDDRRAVEEGVADALERRDAFVLEYRLLHADGSVRWVYERGRGIFGAAGEVVFLDGAIFDVTARKQAEERLAYLAYHDALTDLPNRTLFQERLAETIAAADETGAPAAVLFADLDDFKLINDNFGHSVGDRLLQEVARRLRRVTRAGDVVARQGGDEFLILLAGRGGARLPRAEANADMRAGAERIATALRDALMQPFAIGNVELYVTASVGASIYPEDADSAESLLKHADVALYAAKDAGRDGFQVYRRTGRDHGRELSVAGRLRNAAERGELELHYQPLVDLRERRIVGAEGLIRWNDPERGLTPPAEFLPIAERTGLIRPMTEWVVDVACRQSAAWRNAGHDLFVSVNLAPAFWQPTAMREVMATIETFGLNADRMMIEITEQAAMTPVADLEPVLAELHARGLRLAIDDFGTGHSSLGRLSRLRVNTLKIDRGFIADVPGDRGASILVESMVTLARNLGLHCLAEGIETEEQLAFLTARGCPLGQGYLFGRPMPAEQFGALVRGQRRAA
jgi:diguanylate cyclase (GGDEF)-like protein/PAS domain S-box-containing protein